MYRKPALRALCAISSLSAGASPGGVMNGGWREGQVVVRTSSLISGRTASATPDRAFDQRVLPRVEVPAVVGGGHLGRLARVPPHPWVRLLECGDDRVEFFAAPGGGRAAGEPEGTVAEQAVGLDDRADRDAPLHVGEVTPRPGSTARSSSRSGPATTTSSSSDCTTSTPPPGPHHWSSTPAPSCASHDEPIPSPACDGGQEARRRAVNRVPSRPSPQKLLRVEHPGRPAPEQMGLDCPLPKQYLAKVAGLRRRRTARAAVPVDDRVGRACDPPGDDECDSEGATLGFERAHLEAFADVGPGLSRRPRPRSRTPRRWDLRRLHVLRRPHRPRASEGPSRR